MLSLACHGFCLLSLSLAYSRLFSVLASSHCIFVCCRLHDTVFICSWRSHFLATSIPHKPYCSAHCWIVHYCIISYYHSVCRIVLYTTANHAVSRSPVLRIFHVSWSGVSKCDHHPPRPATISRVKFPWPALIIRSFSTVG